MLDTKTSLSARLSQAQAETRPARLADAPGVVDVLARHPSAEPLLARIAEGSPFLWQLASADTDRLELLLAEAPEASRDRILESVRAPAEPASDEAALMRALRLAKQELALLLGLVDLGGVWDVPEVTAALADLADAATQAALRFLLAEQVAAGKFLAVDGEEPTRGCGLFVLAMGKHGSRELNYSSDIDLIVFYERAIAPLAEGVEPGPFFIKITQRLAKILQTRTADGYVFRVDLRLRPDPGSTPVAMSVEAALSYYESVGQNWERAAMLKARPCAGDIAAGEGFLKEIAPFIWRKYLDYAAISDIHAMKRQIHVHRGHGRIAVEGHNIKLGRGGIREIEFFVQTQQLVAGGRNPALRTRSTEDGLAALLSEGWINAETRDDLVAAYRFLRRVEHCLQMVADEQTHTLPTDPAVIERFARFSGFGDRDHFAADLRVHMERVQAHYARLFEDAQPLAVATGSLVFTGEEDDPETLDTLRRMGFSDPVQVSGLIRGWHHGRVPATRSARARELLTELIPALLDAVSQTSDPGGALRGFERVLSRLPAGVEFFAILRSNRSLLGLLADALGTAPRLAEIIGRRPHVLDAVLEPAFFGDLPDEDEIIGRIQSVLGEAATYEDILDRARVFGQEQRVLIGLRVLSNVLGADRAGAAFARLADCLIAAMHETAEREIEAAHGKVPGGRSCVVAMGKLGGREMAFASDLDLILIYDHPDDVTESSGPRPIAPSQYYARLTQRLTAALSAPTAQGTLYEVDLRLRPSGRSGPLATRLRAFDDYQSQEAWTWEHMALTRAQPVSGPEDLRQEIGAIIRRVLSRERDAAKVAADLREMRGRIAAEKGEGDPWEIKTAAGGLIDLEFLAQYLQLVHAADHPEILSTATAQVFDRARAAGVLAEEDWEVLRNATRLEQDLTQILRLCIATRFEPEAVGPGLRSLLARAAAAPEFAALQAELVEIQRSVREIFDRLTGA